jgi:two-component sensor histidine kinase
MNEETRQLADQLREARDREALLRGELQHRVRNLLAVIRSIFSRTVHAGGSVEDTANHFGGRLDAIARQSLGALEPGATIDFEQLVREELHAFQFGDDPRIAIEGPEIRIGLDAAQLMGLALHELTTNAIKFGALGIDGGRERLSIRWRIEDGMLRFEWLETGVAVIASAPLRSGFGREFIEEALPYQLGAETGFELRPGGVFCAITLPLAALVKRAEPVRRL